MKLPHNVAKTQKAKDVNLESSIKQYIRKKFISLTP